LLGELAQKYADAIRRKKSAETSVKDMSSEADKLEQQLLDEMGAEGLDTIKTSCGMTLYRRTDKFYGVAEGATKEDLVKALGRYEQTADLVTVSFNSISLKARVREIESCGEQMPEEVMSLLKVTERDKVGHRS
jgi:hypothetical protein